MKASEIKAHLQLCGWKEDSWGHMKKEVLTKFQTESGTISKMVPNRFKFQTNSLRLEREVIVPETTYSKATKVWIKRFSCYFKDIKHDDSGALIIGTVRFKAPT